ncbi:hypothetical protein [uncultured Jannaschia sp.]|uniref:hypothetical protein n=1 Tax=uncultured Jannaschia sp. TaxID=293347 RepID=UPI00262A937A|nr:hypothetical protein [uncultured Jannaschia sp.]
MIPRILDFLAAASSAARLSRRTRFPTAPARTFLTLLFLMAGLGQVASEPGLQQQEIATSQRIVFCSGHPDITLEYMRGVFSNWEKAPKAVVIGTSFYESADPADLFFLIIEDELIEETLTACIKKYPPSMKNALTDIVEMIGQPMPEYSSIAESLGPIAGTSRSFSDGEWIGKILATAFTGEDARSLLNEFLPSPR